ncbi:MAG: hypothetical protein K5650_06135 [Bacteroidales bacterium]|nr:hypothetical protein [Bacteroidales bacterium]
MKPLYVIAALLAVTLLTSCNSDKRQIRAAAQGYLEATANYRADDAMPYASQTTRERTLPFLRDKLIPITDSAYMASNTPATIKINKIAINGDTATVDYTKDTPIKILEGQILVVNEEGQWLVYVPLVLPETITIDGRDGTVSMNTPVAL